MKFQYTLIFSTVSYSNINIQTSFNEYILPFNLFESNHSNYLIWIQVFLNLYTLGWDLSECPKTLNTRPHVGLVSCNLVQFLYRTLGSLLLSIFSKNSRLIHCKASLYLTSLLLKNYSVNKINTYFLFFTYLGYIA